MRTFAIASVLLVASAFGQAAPHTWHFTCDYYNFDVKGQLTGRQRYSAAYTRGLPGDVVRWSDVTIASANGWSGDFGPGQKQAFMDGFTYPHSDAANMLKPDFFRGFPPMAMQQRNFVWDTHMLEGFVEHLDHLKPNTPYHVPDAAEVDLAGAGTFRNEVLGELTIQGQEKPLTVSVVRVGVFEPAGQ